VPEWLRDGAALSWNDPQHARRTMTRFLRSAVIAGFGLILSAAAVWQSADAQSATSQPRQDRASRLLRSVDKDNGGTISLDEAKSYASASFDRLDSDHNGMLTLQEYQASVRARLTRANDAERSRLERALTLRETIFRTTNTDKDETVEKPEWLAELEKRFQKADPDHDGTVSVEELRSTYGRALIEVLAP
jgi:Ca2+-binding EF-hand superfamily protein